MKKLLLITFTTLLFAVAALAQDVETPNQNIPLKRPNLLQALDLSPEQVRQIKKINKEQKPKMDAAQRNFREARKALDDAVYAEEFNENDIQKKNKAMQNAQANITVVKTETEVAIRKVLTPEQLVKFRELRIRMIQAANRQNRQMLNNVKRLPNRQQ